MVNIKLDDSWSLTSDSRQWILNLDERPYTFHTSLENAIKSYFEKKIRSSNAHTISGLLEYHKRVLTSLCKASTSFKIALDTKKINGDENGS